MWESIGEVKGSVRNAARRVPVSGKVFFDHTRVLPRRHAVVGRQMYVYTTLALDGGGGVYGYYATDTTGEPIGDYCFCIHVDERGRGRLLGSASLLELRTDADEIASRWQIRYAAADFAVTVAVEVRETRILRAWGSPGAPLLRRDFSIIPLVLDGTALIENDRLQRQVRGCGLAEYFNADLWPINRKRPARAALTK